METGQWVAVAFLGLFVVAGLLLRLGELAEKREEKRRGTWALKTAEANGFSVGEVEDATRLVQSWLHRLIWYYSVNCEPFAPELNERDRTSLVEMIVWAAAHDAWEKRISIVESLRERGDWDRAETYNRLLAEDAANDRTRTERAKKERLIRPS